MLLYAPPKHLPLRSIHTPANPNPPYQLKSLLLSREISTPHHLHQFLPRAIVSGLLQQTHLLQWNSLLDSLSPSLSISLHILLRRAALLPDSYTLTSAFKATALLSLPTIGQQLHTHSLNLGLNSDTFVLNSLINMYSSCGLIGAATAAFSTAPVSALDVVSWNTIISANLQNNLSRESLQFFRQMMASSVAMDAITPVSAFIACGRIGALEHGSAIHALILVKGFHININFYLGSSLITMYAKCGSVQDARKLFDEMPERNGVCWTSMITGYAHCGEFRESIKLFGEMQVVGGARPDDATMASVVSSCAQLGALYHGRYIHAYCDSNGLGFSLTVKNALIDMYSKCGDIHKALQIFRSVLRPDVFSWTAMISGMAMNGNSHEALELFSEMEESSEVVPNEVTFLGVLLACSHGGLVEDGYRYFHSMISVYNLSPKIEHYGCMVDLLGRAELLVECVSFIGEMPIEPDVVIWRSLLFACSRANGDNSVAVAEYASRRIAELEPTESGGRVLLSNVYAVASRWGDVKRVRGFMDNSCMQKQPGCSLIEVDGILHEFFASDGSYAETQLIHEVLSGISRLILSKTCFPDTTKFDFQEGSGVIL